RYEQPRAESTVPEWTSRWGTAIVVLPPLFWLASLALAALKPNALVALSVENGVLETIQHLTLLAAVGVAVAMSLTPRRRGELSWAALYAAGTLVIFWLLGEEISWGSTSSAEIRRKCCRQTFKESQTSITCRG